MLFNLIVVVISEASGNFSECQDIQIHMNMEFRLYEFANVFFCILLYSFMYLIKCLFFQNWDHMGNHFWIKQCLEVGFVTPIVILACLL